MEKAKVPPPVKDQKRNKYQVQPSTNDFIYGPGSRTLEELADTGGLIKDLKDNFKWLDDEDAEDEDKADFEADSDDSRELDERAAARDKTSQEQIVAARRKALK